MFNVSKGLFSLIPKKDGVEKSSSKDNSRLKLTDSFEKSISELERPQSPLNRGGEEEGQEGGSPAREPSSFFLRAKAGTESIFHIEVEKIKPNPFQPRRVFNESQLAELAQSIREFGILQPLIVTKFVKDTESGTEVNYQLVAGERRLIAAKMLGLERVPVIIRDFDDKREKLEAALIENLQRENLNPVEEAHAYSRLQDDFGLTQREIAARVGKSREVVANRLRLLRLPPNIQFALADGKISESQARVILAAADAQTQTQVLATLTDKKLAVRAKAVDPQVQYWARRLEETLGSPVKISKRGEKGKLVISFYSNEEWQAILQKLLGSDTGD